MSFGLHFHYTHHNFDPSPFQFLYSFPRSNVIRINNCRYYLLDTCLNNCINTRRRLAIVRTGFHRYIECGSSAVCTTFMYCINLGVRPSKYLVIAFPNNFTVFYKHSAHHGIGFYLSPPFFSQFQGKCHIFFISIWCSHR